MTSPTEEIARRAKHALNDASLRCLDKNRQISFSASTLTREVALREFIERISSSLTVVSLIHTYTRHVPGTPAKMQAVLLAKAGKCRMATLEARDRALTVPPKVTKDANNPRTEAENALSAWCWTISCERTLVRLVPFVDMGARPLEQAKKANQALRQDLAVLAFQTLARTRVAMAVEPVAEIGTAEAASLKASDQATSTSELCLVCDVRRYHAHPRPREGLR